MPRGCQTDFDASCVDLRLASRNETSASEPTHNHRNGALIGMGKRGELTNGRHMSLVKGLKHEELRTAEANGFLGRSRRDSQGADEQAQVVEDDAGF